MKKDFVKAIAAGVLIAVSSYMYASADDRIVAAFLFPLALIVIIKKNLNLFTGKIGYLEFNGKGLGFVLLVLLGNAVGSLVLLPFHQESYTLFMANKVSQDLFLAFGRGIICGMLMFLAVSFTDDKTNFLLTIMCVAAFLIGKCEHSIADICYMMLGHYFTLEAWIFLLVVALGNSFGAIGLRWLLKATE